MIFKYFYYFSKFQYFKFRNIWISLNSSISNLENIWITSNSSISNLEIIEFQEIQVIPLFYFFWNTGISIEIQEIKNFNKFNIGKIRNCGISSISKISNFDFWISNFSTWNIGKLVFLEFLAIEIVEFLEIPVWKSLNFLKFKYF